MKPISENGVYDIDADLYHTQACCAGPSISSTGLRSVDACPAKFYALSDLNPRRVIAKESKALSFGRAAHAKVLGEPEFNAKFIVSPFDNFRTAASQAWRDEQLRQVITAADLEIIEAMAAAQRNSPGAMRAFSAGAPEKSIIFRDEETGVYVKARPDWLPDFPGLRYACEYKTAETIEPRRLSQAVFTYGYEVQAAVALDAIKIVMGVEPLGMAHVCQEKKPPYLCELRLFTAEQIERGRFLYRRALRRFADCLATNNWPGYTTEPQHFDTPYWVIKQMESMNDDGYAGDAEYPNDGGDDE